MNRGIKAKKNQKLIQSVVEAATRKSAGYARSPSYQEAPPSWCGHLATPGPQKRGPSRIFAALLHQLGERLLPHSSRDPLLLVFPYKYQFQQSTKERRLGLEFVFFSKDLGSLLDSAKVVFLFFNLQSSINTCEREELSACT